MGAIEYLDLRDKFLDIANVSKVKSLERSKSPERDETR